MALSKKKEQEYLEKVKENGMYLKRLKKSQTPKICLTAVRQNGMALRFIENPSPKLMLEAIKSSGITKMCEKPTTLVVGGVRVQYLNELSEEDILTILCSSEPEVLRAVCIILNMDFKPQLLSCSTDIYRIIEWVKEGTPLQTYQTYRQLKALHQLPSPHHPYELLEGLTQY